MKKIVQLYPSLVPRQPDDGNTSANKFLVNVKFCLINVIFSDELSELAMKSEEAATCAELDVGLVGHSSPFWSMVEARFNGGFLSEGVDGMTFVDMIYLLHPLFHQNDTSVDPSIHGQLSSEKLMSVWKDLLNEYDTVMVNFTKSGNHGSSFTKPAMVTHKKCRAMQFQSHLIQFLMMMI